MPGPKRLILVEPVKRRPRRHGHRRPGTRPPLLGRCRRLDPNSDTGEHVHAHLDRAAGVDPDTGGEHIHSHRHGDRRYSDSNGDDHTDRCSDSWPGNQRVYAGMADATRNTDRAKRPPRAASRVHGRRPGLRLRRDQRRPRLHLPRGPLPECHGHPVGACSPTDVAQVQLLSPREATPNNAAATATRDALENILTADGGTVRGLCTNAGTNKGQLCTGNSDCNSTSGSSDGDAPGASSPSRHRSARTTAARIWRRFRCR